jgi:hypothetical protein
MATGEGPYTSEWIKLKGKKETKILRLKGKAKNFASLHPLQSEISQVFKSFKAHVDAKNLKWEDKTWPRWECHK